MKEFFGAVQRFAAAATEAQAQVKQAVSNARSAIVTDLITRLTHPASRHLIVPEVKLSRLGIDAIDRTYTLPMELEDTLGVEFSGDQVEGWRTVGDVLASVEATS